MIHFNNKEHGERLSRLMQRNHNHAVDPVISRTDKDGELMGGVIYDHYTGPAVFIHQAAFNPLWVNRDMLWLSFDYPFNQLKVKKLVAVIPSGNQKLLEINTKLGFNYETTIGGIFDDGDALVMSMTREQCRWLDLRPRTFCGAKPNG